MNLGSFTGPSTAVTSPGDARTFDDNVLFFQPLARMDVQYGCAPYDQIGGFSRQRYLHEVLADLERFCHANSTTHVEGDSHGTAQLEGRRQVWLRIQGYRALNEIPEMEEQADVEE